MNKPFYKKIEFYIALVVFMIISVLFYYSYFLELEMRFFDKRINSRVYQKNEDRVVLVEVTADCLNSYGKWPWARTIHARLLDFLREAGARLVVFDIFFATPSDDDDVKFADAIQKSKNIILAKMFEKADVLDPETGEIINEEQIKIPLEMFSNFALDFGFINVDLKTLNPDGIIRKVPLYREKAKHYDYALSIAAAKNYFHVTPRIDPDGMAIGDCKIPFFSSYFKESGKIENYYLINYRGVSTNGYFTMFPYFQVAEGMIDQSEFKDKIVFVASQINDIKNIPHGPSPGVEVHASVISNILNRDFILKAGHWTSILLFFIISMGLYKFLVVVRPAIYDLFYLATFLSFHYYFSIKAFTIGSVFIEFIPILFIILSIYIAVRFYQLFIELLLTNISLSNANQSLDKKVKELSTLYNISKEVLLIPKLQDLFSKILQESVSVSGASMGLFFLLEPGLKKDPGVFDGRYELKSFLGEEEVSADGLTLEGNFAKELYELKQHVTEESGFALTESLKTFCRSGHFLILPLVLKDSNIGVLMFFDKTSAISFNIDDISLLLTISNQLAMTIENFKLFKESLEKQKLEKELNLAARIQIQMLPKKAPKIEGLDIFGANFPARFVGGDYFDFFFHKKEGYLDFAVGDVSGKGPSAALVVAMVKTVFTLKTKELFPLGVMMTQLNDALLSCMDESLFLTVWFARLDLRTMKMTYVCGGHNPTYLLRNRTELTELKGKGTLIGILPFVSYEEMTVQLQQDDVVILYTDGVNEAMNEAVEQFDYPRFEECIHHCRDSTAQEMYEHISEEIRKFRGSADQSDDITMIILRITDYAKALMKDG